MHVIVAIKATIDVDFNIVSCFVFGILWNIYGCFNVFVEYLNVFGMFDRYLNVFGLLVDI